MFHPKNPFYSLTLSLVTTIYKLCCVDDLFPFKMLQLNLDIQYLLKSMSIFHIVEQETSM